MATTEINDNKYYWEYLAPEYMRALKAEMDEFFTHWGRYPKSDEEWANIYCIVDSRDH